MKKLSCYLVVNFLFITVIYSQVKVDHLHCENLVNPLSVDVQQPRLSWQLVSDKRNTTQLAYEIKVTNDNKEVWESGKVVSDSSVNVVYKGKPLASGAKYIWQVRVWDKENNISQWSEPAMFQMGLLSNEDWKAKWIEAGFPEDTIARPPQLFRKEFSISKKIKSATIYITAHGLYEGYINGKRIGDAYLTPGWTSYTKRLQYQAYDVTDLLNKGANAIGVTIADGWYRGFFTWDYRKNIYGNKLGLLAQLDITYSDGSKVLIVSDDSWRSSTGSFISAEIYDGVMIDGRKEKTGWFNAGYNDQSWSKTVIGNYTFANLIATENESIKAHEEFKAVKVITTPKGEKVIDFGQNLVGWVKVNIKGNAGDTITIHHAEVLDKEGNFYTDNLRKAKETDRYILSGKGEEEFEPRFTFHGFRYIKVEGINGELNPKNFIAVALYSDMAPTGTFSCSNDLVNQLQHNIQWGQRGNFLDIPTDCPQRDERMGWTGDAEVFSRTASYNFNVNNFFYKWMKDVAADQYEDGSVPYVIPNMRGNDRGGATGWADVATIIPWNMYLAYGNKKILEQQFPSMKAWVEYMHHQSKNDLWNTGAHFGDWLFYSPPDDNGGRAAVTDKYFIAQCFYAHSTQLLINAAKVLGKEEDVSTYNSLLKKIKAAFLKEYVTPNGRLTSGTQTAYVLALNFDMLPDSIRTEAAQRLVENIKSYNNHLTTGFLGTPFLCHVLTRFGFDSIAYKLLLQDTYPSWLYPVKMGATTIWERWNGIAPDGSFAPASMNSFNHYSYGAIGDWLYRVVAGIDTYQDNPGYKHSFIKPHVGGNLSYANADLETLYGKISSHWKVADNKFYLDVVIPVNTQCDVYLPTSSVGNVTESGNPISYSKDILSAKDSNDFVMITVGSGSYHFEVKK